MDESKMCTCSPGCQSFHGLHHKSDSRSRQLILSPLFHFGESPHGVLFSLWLLIGLLELVTGGLQKCSESWNTPPIRKAERERNTWRGFWSKLVATFQHLEQFFKSAVVEQGTMVLN